MKDPLLLEIERQKRKDILYRSFKNNIKIK